MGTVWARGVPPPPPECLSSQNPSSVICFVILETPLASRNLGFTACKVGRSITADTVFSVVGSGLPVAGVSLDS